MTVEESYKSRCPFWWKLRVNRTTGEEPDPRQVLTEEEYRVFRGWEENQK